jgi:hypothetical protein
MSKHNKIFTIDLLNGQGLPLKTRPGGIAIVVLTAIVPILLAMGTFGFYLNNRIILSLKDREVAKSEEKISAFSDALNQREKLMTVKTAYTGYLTEVGSSLRKCIQWSPILVTVVANMPESVVLTSLEVECKSVRKDVPKNDGSGETKQVEALVRVLRLRVTGAPRRDCDEAVKEYQERLRASALLGPRLENIRVSREPERMGDQDTFSYEIACIFKPVL